MFVHYVVVKVAVAVCLLFQSASFSCQLWWMFFFLHYHWWHLTEFLWSWSWQCWDCWRGFTCPYSMLGIHLLQLWWSSSRSHFWRWSCILLKLPIYAEHSSSVCNLRGQCCSPGSAAAPGSAICPWGRDGTQTDTACDNLMGVIIFHSPLEMSQSHFGFTNDSRGTEPLQSKSSEIFEQLFSVQVLAPSRHHLCDAGSADPSCQHELHLLLFVRGGKYL